MEFDIFKTLGALASVATIGSLCLTIYSSAEYKGLIIVLLIFAVVLLLFFLFKLYKKIETLKHVAILDIQAEGMSKYIFTEYSEFISIGGIVAVNYINTLWKDRMCLGKIIDKQNEKKSRMMQIEVIYVFDKYKDIFETVFRHKDKESISKMIVMTSINDQDILQLTKGGQL